MNKYVEIMRNGMLKVLTERYSDELTIENVFDVIALVEETMRYLYISHFDIREYAAFKRQIEIRKDDLILEEIKKELKIYHQECFKKCETDPEYRRFEYLTEDEKANSKWDFPERFSTTYKTFNPNEYKDPNERNAALEKWLKFRSKEDYEAAKLANWGHEPDEWIGL